MTTLKLTKLPKNRKNKGCKWVSNTNDDALDEIIRCKAQLMAKIYSLEAAKDLNKISTYVAKFITIKCTLA
jgi:hypothetical protein